MSTLTSRYSGGWLARKLVPIALLVPGAIGLIFMQSGLFKYDLRFGVAALMVSQSVLFVVLISALAYVLNRSENRTELQPMTRCCNRRNCYSSRRRWKL